MSRTAVNKTSAATRNISVFGWLHQQRFVDVISSSSDRLEILLSVLVKCHHFHPVPTAWVCQNQSTLQQCGRYREFSGRKPSAKFTLRSELLYLPHARPSVYPQSKSVDVMELIITDKTLRANPRLSRLHCRDRFISLCSSSRWDVLRSNLSSKQTRVWKSPCRTGRRLTLPSSFHFIINTINVKQRAWNEAS